MIKEGPNNCSISFSSKSFLILTLFGDNPLLHTPYFSSISLQDTWFFLSKMILNGV